MEDIATARAPMQAHDQRADAGRPTRRCRRRCTKRRSTTSGGDVSTSATRPASRPRANPATRPRTTRRSTTAARRTSSCYLTDGEPTRDDDADTAIRRDDRRTPAISFGSLAGSATCDVETYPAGFNPSGGDCLDDLARVPLRRRPLAAGRVSRTSRRTRSASRSTCRCSRDTAARGGGAYYTANDTGDARERAHEHRDRRFSTKDTTFTSPTVAVNAFNRTQNLSDLFVSVFSPPAIRTGRATSRSTGCARPTATIVDANDDARAVDPATGFFFRERAELLVGRAIDGDDVDAGGAANRFPRPASRNVYHELRAATNLTDAGNRVVDDQHGDHRRDARHRRRRRSDARRRHRLHQRRGRRGHEPATTSRRTRATRWATRCTRSRSSVIYGPGLRDGLRVLRDERRLPARDRRSRRGVEQWAFIPPEFLDDQVALYKNEACRDEALRHRRQPAHPDDGRQRRHHRSRGEKVYLFFGMRRGGDFYYALDVTDPDAPQLHVAARRHDAARASARAGRRRCRRG